MILLKYISSGLPHISNNNQYWHLWQFIAYKLLSHSLPPLGLPLALSVRIISLKHMKLLTFNWFVLHKWQFPTVQLNICAIIPILQVRKLRLLLAVWLIQGFLVNDRTVTAFLTSTEVFPSTMFPVSFNSSSLKTWKAFKKVVSTKAA